MVKIRNNMSRNVCLNLDLNESVRLKAYEIKEIKDTQISEEVKANELVGNISIIKEKKPKVVKSKKKVETKKRGK